MAYVAGDQQHVIYGSALGGAEEFAISYAISDVTTDLTPAVTTFVSALAAVMSTTYEFQGFKATLLNATPITYDIPFSTTIPGEDSSGPLPPQCAVRVSLKTAHPGRSGRGGFYLPGLCKGGISTTTARVGSGTLGTIADAVGDFTTDLQAEGASLCVNSRTLSTLFSVNSARVGDVVDTIRRRRDVLVENFTAITIA